MKRVRIGPSQIADEFELGDEVRVHDGKNSFSGTVVAVNPAFKPPVLYYWVKGGHRYYAAYQVSRADPRRDPTR